MRTESKYMQRNSLSYSVQTKAKFFVKLSLLILASPISIALCVSSLRSRVFAWLNRDLERERCFNTWKSFQEEKFPSYPSHNEKDFNTAFILYPKTLTFLSRCFNNLELGNFYFNDSSDLSASEKLYVAIVRIMWTEDTRKKYLEVSEKYLDVYGESQRSDSLTDNEVYLVQQMIESGDCLTIYGCESFNFKLSVDSIDPSKTNGFHIINRSYQKLAGAEC